MGPISENLSGLIDEQVIKEFLKSSKFLANNMLSLRRQYGDKYIAVSDGEVVASADTPEELKETLAEAGIDYRKVLIEYIPPADIIYIL